MENIQTKLQKIQSELNVPKNQTNSFGHYQYRSCEDILNAVKPILEKNKTLLFLSDELVNIGQRYYVKARAVLFDLESEMENKNSLVVESYAREEEDKKGMDGSQITGACSSYARKYALNGLFLIDDEKDSDSTNQGNQTKAKIEPKSTVAEDRAIGGTITLGTVEYQHRKGISKKGESYDAYFPVEKDSKAKIYWKVSEFLDAKNMEDEEVTVDDEMDRAISKE